MSGVWGSEENGLDDQVPFLARLEREDRIALLSCGRELSYQPRDHLLHQGEPSAHVLLLLDGWTKVTATAATGYVALLALRGPGDVVGESAAVTGRPRSAAVIALEPVRAVAIEHARFRTALTDRPQVALRLLSLVADRTRAADRRRLEYASLDVRERLATLLLELARSHGHHTERGVELTVPLSQEELAGSVGASGESVKKLLTELRRENVVATGRRSIVLLRPDILRKICAVNRN